MTSEKPLLTDEEVESEFNLLVKICKKLQQEKRLFSGIEFFIKDDQIAARSIPPSRDQAQVLESIPNLLRKYHQVRQILTEMFGDIESAVWNKLEIGKALNYIEQHFRLEVYAVEASGRNEDKVYNIFVIVLLVQSMTELATLLLTPSFRKKWKWKKLRALNAWATEFFTKNQNHARLRMISMCADLTLAIDESRNAGKLAPDNVYKLMRIPVEAGTLHGIEVYFFGKPAH